MSRQRVRTQNSGVSYKVSPTKNTKRLSTNLMNVQLLRLEVLEKQQSIKKIFGLSQTHLCNFFVNYKPMIQSKINLKKIMDRHMEQVRLIKSNNKLYFGEVKGKVKHGQGILVDDKGKIYEGIFDLNDRNGYGIEIYPNGNIYIGFFQNNKKHGKGQFYWFTLSPPIKESAKFVEFYEGGWWGGLPDGSGCHQKSNGDYYDGTFKNGLKHGQGQQYFYNNDSYKGQYVNGLPEGFGVYHWQDGSRYEGDFKQGMRSGQGCWIASNEEQTYRGPYILDKKCGYGEYRWKDGYYYKGNFENDLRNGFGQLYEDHQLRYRGDWINGQMVHEEKSFISPKNDKLPSLKRLKPPSSSIIQRLKVRNLSPVSQKSQKSVERSRSPKSSLYGGKKLKKLLTQISDSTKQSRNKRPLSLANRQKLPVYDYNLRVRKCTKKQCSCNSLKKPATVSRFDNRSVSSKRL